MCGGNPWPTGTEPSLDELLSDPIAVALRRSDRLTRRMVETVLARAAKRCVPKPALLPPPAAPAEVRPRAGFEFDFDAEPELTLSG